MGSSAATSCKGAANLGGESATVLACCLSACHTSSPLVCLLCPLLLLLPEMLCDPDALRDASLHYLGNIGVQVDAACSAI